MYTPEGSGFGARRSKKWAKCAQIPQNDTKIASAAPPGSRGGSPGGVRGGAPRRKFCRFCAVLSQFCHQKFTQIFRRDCNRSMCFGCASQPAFSVASPALLLRLQLLLWQLRCRRAIGGLDGPTAARTSMHDVPHDALAARRLCGECRASAQPLRRGAAPYGDACWCQKQAKSHVCLQNDRFRGRPHNKKCSNN